MPCTTRFIRARRPRALLLLHFAIAEIARFCSNRLSQKYRVQRCCSITAACVATYPFLMPPRFYHISVPVTARIAGLSPSTPQRIFTGSPPKLPQCTTRIEAARGMRRRFNHAGECFGKPGQYDSLPFQFRVRLAWPLVCVSPVTKTPIAANTRVIRRVLPFLMVSCISLAAMLQKYNVWDLIKTSASFV